MFNMDLTLVLCLILPIAMSLPLDDRDGANEPGLEPEDFRHGEDIDTDNEIPDGEDPLRDAHEKGKKFQGDLDLTPEQLAFIEGGLEKPERSLEERQVVLSNHWPRNGDNIYIPYTMNHNEFSAEERANIARGFEEYERLTCFRMVPRTSEVDYVSVMRGGGCYSSLGKRGGKQDLSLAKGCASSVGTPIHEFMHAIGYLHEQSRKDRDAYVEIEWDNIEEKYKSQFRICEDCDLQGLPYDLGSVMHYPAWAFAIDRSKPAIVAKEAGAKIGQRNGFSESDVEGLNNLFCKDTCYVDKRATADCKRWKGHCGGEQWGAWMAENCARTCEVCTDGNVKICSDVRGSANCGGWKWACTDANNLAFMTENCAKTCGFCS